MSPIEEPYLLSVCVPVSIDHRGRRWTNELWAKDLELHLGYITDLTIACPVIKRQPQVGDVCLSNPPFRSLKFVDLPYPRTYGAAFRSLPELVAKLWKATRKSSIVHSGFGSWPFAEGWFLTPIGKLQKKLVVTNVESSFWRSDGPQVSWRKKLLSNAMEQLTRFTVRIADVRFFTSKAYAAEFLPEDAPCSYVVPATWVNEEWILSKQRADAAWDAKHDTTRLIFAGRLVAEKGVEVLLKAIDEAKDAKLVITIIGEGPMRDQCVRATNEKHGSVSVRFLDPVPYGEPFLETLRSHDAVLIPSLSSEQPRLLFDAFSQSVPVIGSATGGICDLVEQGITGRLVPPGDPVALAEALNWASENRIELRTMGLAALAKGREATHPAMHKRRQEILLDALTERAKYQEKKRGDETRPWEAYGRTNRKPSVSAHGGLKAQGKLVTDVASPAIRNAPSTARLPLVPLRGRILGFPSRMNSPCGF